MPMVTTKDGTQIFYKDWGPKDVQPLVFHHGWPLSSDDWDAQMLFFLRNGFRAVAHDRRGHGRSAQVDTGHDMDHYASDASAIAEHLDLKNAIHIGHSTGGGDVARYVAKYGEPQGRVAKAALIAAVPRSWTRPSRTRGETGNHIARTTPYDLLMARDGWSDENRNQRGRRAQDDVKPRGTPTFLLNTSSL